MLIERGFYASEDFYGLPWFLRCFSIFLLFFFWSAEFTVRTLALKASVISA